MQQLEGSNGTQGGQAAIAKEWETLVNLHNEGKLEPRYDVLLCVCDMLMKHHTKLLDRIEQLEARVKHRARNAKPVITNKPSKDGVIKS